MLYGKFNRIYNEKSEIAIIEYTFSYHWNMYIVYQEWYKNITFELLWTAFKYTKIWPLLNYNCSKFWHKIPKIYFLASTFVLEAI